LQDFRFISFVLRFSCWIRRRSATAPVLDEV